MQEANNLSRDLDNHACQENGGEVYFFSELQSKNITGRILRHHRRSITLSMPSPTLLWSELRVATTDERNTGRGPVLPTNDVRGESAESAVISRYYLLCLDWSDEMSFKVDRDCAADIISTQCDAHRCLINQ